MTGIHTQVQPSQFSSEILQALGTATSWVPDLRSGALWASPILAVSIKDPCLAPDAGHEGLSMAMEFCLLLMTISLAGLFLSGDCGSLLLAAAPCQLTDPASPKQTCTSCLCCLAQCPGLCSRVLLSACLPQPRIWALPAHGPWVLAGKLFPYIGKEKVKEPTILSLQAEVGFSLAHRMTAVPTPASLVLSKLRALFKEGLDFLELCIPAAMPRFRLQILCSALTSPGKMI